MSSKWPQAIKTVDPEGEDLEGEAGAPHLLLPRENKSVNAEHPCVVTDSFLLLRCGKK